MEPTERIRRMRRRAEYDRIQARRKLPLAEKERLITEKYIEGKSRQEAYISLQSKRCEAMVANEDNRCSHPATDGRFCTRHLRKILNLRRGGDI